MPSAQALLLFSIFMKHRHFPSLLAALLAGLLGLLPTAVARAQGLYIDFLDLNDCPVSDVARILTSLTGETVVVTELSRAKTVDALVEGASLEAALKVICRSSGLVYRYDADSQLYTILALEEYQSTTLQETQGEEQTRTFKVGVANLTQIASGIQQLFGQRVLISAGEAIEDFREAPGQAAGGFNSRSQRVYGGGGYGGLGRSTTSTLNRNWGGYGNGYGGYGGYGGFGVTGAQLVYPGLGNYGNNLYGDGYYGNNLYGGNYYGDNFARSQQRFASLPQSNLSSNRLGPDGTPLSLNSEEALEIEAARSRAAAEGTPLSLAETRQQRARESGEAIIFVSLNYEHSMLLVRTADTKAIDQIAKLVESLDLIVPQVILEMKILQLDVGDAIKAGVSFDSNTLNEQFNTVTRDPVTGAPTEIEFAGFENALGVGNFATESAATLAYSLISDQIRARIDLFANDNRVEVIATPVLIATNNRSAQIEVGEERILTVGASTDQITSPLTGAVQTVITTETEKRTIGIVLDILPRINNDGTVTLSVYQESTTLKPANNSIQVGSELVPIDSVDTANVDATVVARDKNTIAVGGLIRTESAAADTKVPLLGDVPVLRNAFRKREKSARKTEIILLITPYILNSGDDSMEESRKIVERLSDQRWHVGGDAIVERDNRELHRYRTDTTRSYRKLTGDPEAVPEKTQHWREMAPPAKKWSLFSKNPKPAPPAQPATPAPIQSPPPPPEFAPGAESIPPAPSPLPSPPAGPPSVSIAPSSPPAQEAPAPEFAPPSTQKPKTKPLSNLFKR